MMIQTSNADYPFEYISYYVYSKGKWRPLRRENSENAWLQGFWSKDGNTFIVTSLNGADKEFAYDYMNNKSYYIHSDIKSLTLQRGGKGREVFSSPTNLDGKTSYPWFWDILSEPEY